MQQVIITAERAGLVTKDDTKTLGGAGDVANMSAAWSGTAPPYARRLYVGGTGAVNVVTLGGDTVLFSAIPAGTFLDIACTKVLNTGTTATLLVALY